jgi:hypothetical protein
MKQSRLSGLLFYSMVFLLVSCSGGGTEKKATTDSTATDTTAVVTVPKITTITTPQFMLVITHKVSNYAKWKASYDQHDSARLANGIHNYVIGRGFKDSNMIMVALKVDDSAKAKAFGKDPGLKKAMQKGGVIGTPTVVLNTMTFQDTVSMSTDLRARTTFTVKDWAAWVKAYEEARQEKSENGITLRAYGHNSDNDKKVVLVTAITDTAKAFAYYKSDLIKKRRAESGVIGEPERFLYRVVAHY